MHVSQTKEKRFTWKSNYMPSGYRTRWKRYQTIILYWEKVTSTRCANRYSLHINIKRALWQGYVV